MKTSDTMRKYKSLPFPTVRLNDNICASIFGASLCKCLAKFSEELI